MSLLPVEDCSPTGPYPAFPCWVTTGYYRGEPQRFIHDPERPDRTAVAFGVEWIPGTNLGRQVV